jgi:hypothetical protein
LVSNAYSVEFEVPTSATVPGTVTLTGDFSMSRLPSVQPKNDPQCLTVDGVSGLAIAEDDPPADDPPAEGPDDAEQPAVTSAAAARHNPTRMNRSSGRAKRENPGISGTPGQ